MYRHPFQGSPYGGVPLQCVQPIIVCVWGATCRQELEERYGGKMTKHMSGSLYEVFSKVMRALVGKKITVPGAFKKFEPI